MGKQSLTDLGIRRLSPPKKGQLEVWDVRVPGFGVRVSQAGTKAFVLLYRYHGKARRMTLGRYPTLSLQDARWAAQGALRTIAMGTDPILKERERAAGGSIDTFGGFVQHFIDAYARPKNRSAGDTMRLLQREFVSRWGTRSLSEISKKDVAAVLDAIMRDGRHTMANRSLAAIRKVFNWAVERGHLAESPCVGIKKPARENTRDRVLTSDELRAIWNAAVATDYPFGAIIRLLILTGQRRSEVASMRWSGVDLAGRVWSIARQFTKSDRPHAVPLGSMAIDLLSSLPRLGGDLVFPARGTPERFFSGFGKCKERLDEMSGTTDWRVHDLRRTFATMQAQMGTPPHVIERILNHQVGTLTPIAKIYNRHLYFPEMVEAIARYEDKIRKLLETHEPARYVAAGRDMS